MKRARGVLVFVLVIVLLLSIPGATVFAQETVNDLGPVSSKDVIYQIITDRFYDGDSKIIFRLVLVPTYMTELGQT